ncbi:MAG TPA: pyridoxamine 5'-phosphate oxidase family protein [Solirubrobacterales bacterium]|nr:pyridoxamine 5'-phosphate oxidase family protein [Solirubrobacterales bacterium]
MSRRDLIRMTDEEVGSFLVEGRVVTCASVGPDGRPHLMPLWYVPDGEALLCWTYAASQKAKNLRRDPRATLQIESGDSYEELRGVMFEADADLIEAPEEVAAIGLRLALRYAPGDLTAEDAPSELRDFVAAQAGKRLALRFRPTRTVSWDHRKLAGKY